MKYYIGADLGTSALKLIHIDSKGEIVNSVTKEYPLFFPKSNWSESKRKWEVGNRTLSSHTCRLQINLSLLHFKDIYIYIHLQVK